MAEARARVSPGGFSLGIWTRRAHSAKRSSCRRRSSSISRALSAVMTSGRGGRATRGVGGGAGGQRVAGEAALDAGARRREVERAVGAHGRRLRPRPRVEQLVLLVPPREL